MISLKKQFLVCFFAALLTAIVIIPAFGQEIQTAAEKTGFEEYTGYEDMMQYLQDIQAASTEMLLSSFGTTIEGREQPYAVFSRPMVTQPWEAMVSGKPIVVMAANVHGGERTIRESMLLLTRELASNGTPMNSLLNDLVVLVIPSINPDGFVRRTRGNSQGVDLNRDYMKLEQPALANFVQNILHTWRPHVFLDGHNGGAYPYNICYQGPAHVSSDQRITDLCDQEIFPFIGAEMEKSGYRAWYYSGGDSTSWRTAPIDPRISINYGGFINCFGILFESPSQDRSDGAQSGLIASRALLQYTADNADRVMMIVDRARRETIMMGQSAMGEIPVQMEKVAEDYKVSYEIAILPGGRREGESREEANQRRQIVYITGADLMKKPVVTKSRPRPYAYVLEPRAHKAVEMLKRQKVMIEVLSEDTEITVEAYELDSLSRRSQYDHPASTTLFVKDETVKSTQIFPKGTYIIRTGQSMGRIICHLLEPETDDNVITWNAMDALLPSIRGRGRQSGDPTRTPPPGAPPAGAQQEAPPPVIPIFKIMTPVELSTIIVEYRD
ncbi:DUF2817 domain-containing protein [candidate division KSB1 bacterium]